MRLSLFAVLFSNIIYAQNTLQYNLKVGDTISVFQKASQNIVQDMEGSKHEMKNILEADFTFIISNKTDSTYTITFKYDRFKMLTTSNLYGEVLNVDTKIKSSNDVQSQIFSQMIGTNLNMILYKNGKIKSVSGTEKMISKMVDKAGITDELTKLVMIESMKKEFGNESLARSFEQMTFIYPNKKVMVGDTWTNTYKGKLNAKNIWKLDAINEKSIELSAMSQVKMSTEDTSISMTLEGNQQTVITTNKVSGFIKDMIVNLNAEGISVFAQIKDMEIPTTITSTTNYKTIKHVQ